VDTDPGWVHAVAVMATTPARGAGTDDPVANEPIDEWKECRATTARFDGYLVDTRKYGFTLVTVLLTANALVVDKNTAVDRPAASIVILALLFALFMLDNYYWVVLRAAVERSRQLEDNELKGFRTQLSTLISKDVRDTHATDLILAVYVVFALVAAGIGLTAGIASGANAASGTIFVIVVAAGQLVAMGFIFLKVQPKAPPAEWFRKNILGQKGDPGDETGGLTRGGVDKLT
jgi:hypothetical protein